MIVFVTDHLGTPLRLIDHNGKTRWAAVAEETGVRQPIWFQGQWLDEESGLYYNRYRYYDPTQGRYVTQDPIGLWGGLNGYAYPINPLRRVDPLGLDGVSPQLANARDTAINAAITAGTNGMSNSPGGLISAGTAASQGATAIGSVLESAARNDHRIFMALGDHTMNTNTCIGEEVNKIDWNEFNTFEEGYSHVVSICLKK